LDDMTTPTLSYLIASTPRSGSTLLCEALTNTGVAGNPEEYYQHRRKTGLPRRPLEYFEEVETPEIDAILGAYTRVDDEMSLFDPRRFESYRDWIDWTIERATTPNGVFGAKVMWGYFNGFVSGLQELPGRSDLPRADLLPSVFPNLRYVSVTREDKVRQAVSLWKALQSWTWRRDAGDGHIVRGDLRYSFVAIDHLAGAISDEEDAWHAYFREAGVQPHAVVYERFENHYEEVALEIIDYLGIERSGGVAFAERQMKRQADSLSDEWIARYHADKGARLADA
jgi:LPS sulfotransferase NodH